MAGNVIGGNQTNSNRDKFDHYPTPDAWSRVLFRHETFTGNILEPCAGNGIMARVIAVNCPDSTLRCTDVEFYDPVEDAPRILHGDIFNWNREDGIDNIITNPPYQALNEILIHTMTIAHKKLALLLKLVSLEGVGRGKFYKLYPPSKIIVISNRMPNSQFGHAWFIWDKTKRRNPGRTELIWDEAR